MTSVAGPTAGSAPASIERPGAFRVEIHREAAAVRVVPVGELDLAASAELTAELRRARTAGPGAVVLDLRELAFIDSTGIRVILAEDREARGAGREFAVISGPPAVQRIFEISGVGGHLRFRAA